MSTTVSTTGQPGANSRPEDIAAAARHTHPAAAGTEPNRAATADAAAATAVTRSAHADPAGPGGTGSTTTATTTAVNQPRTASDRSASLRSHPRTVSTGRPNTLAIDRAPAPPTRSAIAAPITSTVSARLTSTNTGNNTCVTPHPRHRARRGTSR
jgi:hypothetical protein